MCLDSSQITRLLSSLSTLPSPAPVLLLVPGLEHGVGHVITEFVGRSYASSWRSKSCQRNHTAQRQLWSLQVCRASEVYCNFSSSILRCSAWPRPQSRKFPPASKHIFNSPNSNISLLPTSDLPQPSESTQQSKVRIAANMSLPTITSTFTASPEAEDNTPSEYDRNQLQFLRFEARALNSRMPIIPLEASQTHQRPGRQQHICHVSKNDITGNLATSIFEMQI